MLQFKSAPPKNRGNLCRLAFSDRWVNLDLSLLPLTQETFTFGICKFETQRLATSFSDLFDNYLAKHATRITMRDFLG